MLTSLSIRDFAVISRSELEFSSGMTVISGETGAGKSLLVDALGFLSGQRGDAGVVRHGAERAELSATFRLDDAPAATAWLSANDLDEGDEVLLRRVLRADGGSKAWINGRPATLAQLAEIAGHLVEIHGQHAQQRLLSKPQQLVMLDELGVEKSLLATVSTEARAWRDARAALDALTARGDVESQRIELADALARLDEAVLDPEGQQALFARHARMSHGAELMEACARAAGRLEGDETAEGLVPALHALQNALGRATAYEPRLAEVVQCLDAAVINAEEAARLLAVVRDDVDDDPETLQRTERELSRLQELARRHRTRVEHLHEIRASLSAELSSLDGAELDQARLEAALAAHAERWQTAAGRLTAARTKAARQLGDAVTGLMAQLGMAGGRFEVALEPRETTSPDPAGAERVEFLVSANPGQPPRPLRKVASGGELSRIALAIQVAAMQGEIAPTLLFDEVDSGIGGAVADVVGAMLQHLSARCQVMCVTHLPQVAAHGTHHYRVDKSKAGGLTQSALEVLDEDSRIDELARMLGGSKRTTAVTAAARALREDATKT